MKSCLLLKKNINYHFREDNMNEDEMKITLPPVYWNQYRLQKVINKEIDTLVENKIIDKDDF